MPPLVEELAGCRAEPGAASTNDLPAVEPIAARPRLVAHRAQVRADCGHGCARLPEALELRMSRVSLGQAAQHGLGQKRLAPECDQPARVKVLRMERPEA